MTPLLVLGFYEFVPGFKLWLLDAAEHENSANRASPTHVRNAANTVFLAVL